METDLPGNEERREVANGVELATCELEHEKKRDAVNGVELATCDLEHKAQTDEEKCKQDNPLGAVCLRNCNTAPGITF